MMGDSARAEGVVTGIPATTPGGHDEIGPQASASHDDHRESAAARTRTSGRRLFLVLAAAAWVTRLVLGLAYPEFVDDVYIYMRYVENWTAGDGLVFNIGEPVIAFTSYAYVVLIAAAHKVAFGAPLAAVVTGFNLVVFAGFCVIVGRFLDRSRPLYWATAIFLFFYFPFLDAGVSGMETALFTTVIAAALLALRTGRYELAVIASALAAMTRPEGVLLVIPVCALALPRLTWLARVRAVAISAGLVAAFLVPIYAYYGSVLPQSMLAKSAGNDADWAGIATSPPVKAVLLAFGMPDQLFLWLPPAPRIALLGLVALLAAAFAVAVVRAWRRDPAIIAAAAFYALTVCFYSVGNPVRIPSWYTVAPAMCFAIVASYGIEEAICRYRADRSRPPSRRFGVLAAALTLAVCAGSAIIALPARIAGTEGHVNPLRQVAETVGRDFPDARSLMIGDIGVIGYTTKLHIVDLAALVSPESIAQRDGHRVSFGRLVEETRPDLICLKSDPLRNQSISWPTALRHTSFDDDTQRSLFVGSYARTDLHSSACPVAFRRIATAQ